MNKWIKLLAIEILFIIWILNFNLSIIVSFIWIVLHEIAHIILALKNGCKFNNFSVSILGAKAEILDIDQLMDNKKLSIYLAGPILNISVSIALYWLYNFLQFDFIRVSIVINLCLGLFNLLPAYPLDGSRILEILLCKRFIYKKSKKITEIVSLVISGTLFLLFVIMLLLHKVNISLLLTSLLITYTTILEKRKTMYIIMGDIIRKVRKLKRYNYLDNKCISIYYRISLVNVLKMVDKNKFNTFYIINEDMKLLSIIHEDELIVALKQYGNITLEEYLEIRNS